MSITCLVSFLTTEDICGEKRICGDYGVCRRVPAHYICVCGGNKKSVKPKPCLDGCAKKYTCGNTTGCDLRTIGHVCICKENEKLGNTQDCISLPCPSDQECDQDDDNQSEETTNNPYCSILTFASGINMNCQNHSNSKSQTSLPDIAEFVSNMSHRESKWFDMNSNQRLKTVTRLLSSLESTVMLTAIQLNTTDYNLTTNNMDVQIQILQTIDGAMTLSDDGNEMEFHWKKYSHEFAAVSFITCSKMEILMGDSGLEMNSKKYGTEYLQLYSKVLIATVTSSKQTQQNTTFTIKNKKAVCAAIAGILHYLFLACFLWMLLEGVQLYLMVVKVFWVQSLRGKYTQPIAYGIPALIVIISAATNPRGYGTREYCWLSMEKGFRWSFVGPLCAICLSNLVFLILTIWRLAQKFHTINPDLSNLQKLRILTPHQHDPGSHQIRVKPVKRSRRRVGEFAATR
ncbi:hypothetical protein chiPu_0020779 [Chiloscyllium punctatum]|uniref:G-protein coupled receptors family 2 profile 2 domain-containing protein n=1 Tax=Chiloscyllium punctatum TaxID=137246 RepID=A0A401RJR7_CHIPU|nr:hypothetical protein [Chiloscyllium punctatum]